jgi:hypothetical protein
VGLGYLFRAVGGRSGATDKRAPCEIFVEKSGRFGLKEFGCFEKAEAEALLERDP